MRATYGSHNEEEGQAFVHASPVQPRSSNTTRRVVIGTSIALLGAAAATAAYVALVEPTQVRPATTNLDAKTVIQSLAAQLSLDDQTDTTFEALDVDGNGVVTKDEYLSRLSARRDDVLVKLQQSNLADNVKQPIDSLIRDNYDTEAACVANVFNMSGDRVVDKATFEFVHPLVVSLCKKSSLNSVIPGITEGDEGTPGEPTGPQVDLDGNVIAPAGASGEGVSIDGEPAAPNASIDGAVPVQTPATTFDDDLLPPSPVEEGSNADEANPTSNPTGATDEEPTSSSESPTVSGDEDTGDDSTTTGMDENTSTEIPATGEDVDAEEGDTGDDSALPSDNTPSEEPASDESGAETTTESPPADETTGQDEPTSEEPTSDEDADETTESPSPMDEGEPTEEPVSDENTESPSPDETAPTEEGGVSTEEPASDINDTTPESPSPNEEGENENEPGQNVDENGDNTTGSMPGTNDNGEDQATADVPTGGSEDETNAPGDEATDEDTTNDITESPSLSEDQNNTTATPPGEANVTDPNTSVGAILSEVQDAVSDVSLPGDGTVNVTTGGLSNQDPTVIKTFVNELNPEFNETDPDAPEAKSPERIAFETALAKTFDSEFADRTQRLAYANLQVKKNAFEVNLIQECITHAGRRFAFDASYTHDQATEWIKTKCLVFPDLFQQQGNP